MQPRSGAVGLVRTMGVGTVRIAPSCTVGVDCSEESVVFFAAQRNIEPKSAPLARAAVLRTALQLDSWPRRRQWLLRSLHP